MPVRVLPVEFGLDVGGDIDIVDDETLEVATEVAVAPIAVDDFQTADFAIADLRAGASTPFEPSSTTLGPSGASTVGAVVAVPSSPTERTSPGRRPAWLRLPRRPPSATLRWESAFDPRKTTSLRPSGMGAE
jgi:hypothetical protein